MVFWDAKKTTEKEHTLGSVDVFHPSKQRVFGSLLWTLASARQRQVEEALKDGHRALQHILQLRHHVVPSVSAKIPCGVLVICAFF